MRIWGVAVLAAVLVIASAARADEPSAEAVGKAKEVLQKLEVIDMYAQAMKPSIMMSAKLPVPDDQKDALVAAAQKQLRAEADTILTSLARREAGQLTPGELENLSALADIPYVKYIFAKKAGQQGDQPAISDEDKATMDKLEGPYVDAFINDLVAPQTFGPVMGHVLDQVLPQFATP